MMHKLKPKCTSVFSERWSNPRINLPDHSQSPGVSSIWAQFLRAAPGMNWNSTRVQQSLTDGLYRKCCFLFIQMQQLCFSRERKSSVYESGFHSSAEVTYMTEENRPACYQGFLKVSKNNEKCVFMHLPWWVMEKKKHFFIYLHVYLYLHSFNHVKSSGFTTIMFIKRLDNHIFCMFDRILFGEIGTVSWSFGHNI